MPFSPRARLAADAGPCRNTWLRARGPAGKGGLSCSVASTPWASCADRSPSATSRCNRSARRSADSRGLAAASSEDGARPVSPHASFA
eukprot:14941549-Alexandrium_andersonii.AAC.1